MDGPVFDAMLKNALEEALRQEVEEAPAPPPPSRRQRRRMSRLLANPRSVREAERRTEAERRLRNPARWLAAVVVAALLTGAAAAGLALGGGERFRRMFEENAWAADYYGNAADTEQLLDLGAEMDTTLVESGGLRFEMLDAVFDGQMAMAELRMTILDPALREELEELEKLDKGGPFFRDAEILLENGRDVGSWGYSSSSWRTNEDLEEGEYALIFSVNDEVLNTGGRCGIRLRDLVCWDEEEKTLLRGEWTLSITLRPTEVLRLEPKEVCRMQGEDWILDSVTLSPLALGLSFHRESGGNSPESPGRDEALRRSVSERRQFPWLPLKDLSFRLKGGEVLEIKGSSAIGSSDTHVDARVELPMPLDLEQVEALRVCGLEIPLSK